MSGILTTITKIFGGDKSAKDIRSIMPLVEQIKEEYKKLPELSHDQLRGKSEILRHRIQEGTADIQSQIDDLRQKADLEEDVHIKEDLYDQIDELIKQKDERLEEVLMEVLPEAFAVVKETARRFKENKELIVTATELDKELGETCDYIQITGSQAKWQNTWVAGGNRITWDMLHYDVQLIGGVVLHQGKIAEMATGEGKTLVATLPAYLNALVGEGVHIVTVNDYLAKRDQEWMGPIFEFLGVTVDCIDKYQPHSEGRKKAYRAGVTYGTNNEFGFDYLRDNMAHSPRDLVLRKHHYAMVDEVDSVLIDDARTPLIISGPVPKGDQQEYLNLKPRIQRLVEAQKKIVNQFLTTAKQEIAQGKDGPKAGGLALLRAHRGLPKTKAIIKYLSEEGIKTKLLKTEGHYLRDQAKDMPLVDEELYFVIEEKQNSVELTDKGIELITGSGEDPNFFVLPDIGAEVAEIEKSGLSDEEKLKKKDILYQEYAIKGERLHSVHQLLKAYALFEKDVEYVLMDGKVKIVDEQTGRVMEGRRYSDGLHQAIEAKENVKVESATQTYATVTLQNYFRMYHKLSGMTGTAETEAGEFWEIYELDVVVIPTNVPVIRDDRDDKLYKTKKDKYNAVIDEVKEQVGKGRPVLVGTTSVEVSELLSRMLKMNGIQHNVLNAKQHQREAEIVAQAGQPGQVTIATNMAGRGTDIKLTPEVKKAGGLAIIGTERHESRRVDRQLRGRAGRQGDPGTSQFYVSLEDNLMRLFANERISKMMDRLGYKEGDVIQHKWINNSIQRAQKKVEENNFGIRKRLLEYDDVMNAQREHIYKKRKHALLGERLKLDLLNAFYEVGEELINTYKPAEDWENFRMDCMRILSVEPPFEESVFLKADAGKLSSKLFEEIDAHYKRKAESLIKMAMPVLKDVFKSRGTTVQNIAIPFSDGRRGLHARVPLKEAVEGSGRELITGIEKSINLAIIDEQWKEHLRQMDDLKQSVQAAAYEQKDPLLIYKFEAFELFKAMLAELNREVSSFLLRGNIPIDSGDQVQQAREPQQSNDNLQTSRTDHTAVAAQRAAAQAGAAERKRQPVVVEKKYGRNDKVKVLNPNTGETRQIKYKVAEPMLSDGWELVE